DVRSGADAHTGQKDGQIPDAAPWCFDERDPLLTGLSGYDAQLSADGLELFFVRGTATTWDLWHAKRADSSLPFTAGLVLTELATSNLEETDPALTEDGLTLVFKSNRITGQHAWQATRANKTTPFSTPALVAGLEDIPVFGLDVSPDGTTIYYDD